MADDSTAGALVLGLVGTGVGVFIVDHAFSAPGESWFDKLTGHAPEETHREEHPEALPEEQRPVARELPPSREHEGPGFFERLAQAFRPPFAPGAGAGALRRGPKQMLAAPSAAVREAQSRLNALHLESLQKQGLIPPDVHLPLDPDGVLGKDTYRVLQVAQQQLGLSVTGRADEATLRALREKTSGVSVLAPPPPRAQVRTAPQPPRAQPRPPSVQPRQPITYYPAPSPSEMAQYQPHPCPPGSYYEPWAGACLPVHRTGADVGGDWKGEASSLGDAAVNIIQHAIDQETNPRQLLGLAKSLEAANFPITAAAVKAKSPAGAKVGFWGDHLVGWPPSGYEGGSAAGSCPPGTSPECVPPPLTQLVPLASGEFDVRVGEQARSYYGGPFVMFCPQGTKVDCLPPPARLVPIASGEYAVGLPPVPTWRPDFAFLDFDPEGPPDPSFMGWW